MKRSRWASADFEQVWDELTHACIITLIYSIAGRFLYRMIRFPPAQLFLRAELMLAGFVASEKPRSRLLATTHSSANSNVSSIACTVCGYVPDRGPAACDRVGRAHWVSWPADANVSGRCIVHNNSSQCLARVSLS